MLINSSQVPVMCPVPSPAIQACASSLVSQALKAATEPKDAIEACAYATALMLNDALAAAGTRFSVMTADDVSGVIHGLLERVRAVDAR